eukprot:scaffold23588_cov51-Isochrysis_galbana.AAC.1
MPESSAGWITCGRPRIGLVRNRLGREQARNRLGPKCRGPSGPKIGGGAGVAVAEAGLEGSGNGGSGGGRRWKV